MFHLLPSGVGEAGDKGDSGDGVATK